MAGQKLGFAVAALVALTPASLLAQPKESQPFPGVRLLGEAAVEKTTLMVKATPATVILEPKDADAYRAAADVMLASKAGAMYVQVLPTEPRDFQKSAALHAYITHDAAGLHLQTGTYKHDGKTWAGNQDIHYLHYWRAPTDKANLALLELGKVPKQSWQGRWLPLRVDVTKRTIALWLDGWLLAEHPRPAGMKGPVAIKLEAGDQIRDLTVTPLPAESPFLTVDLSGFVNDRFAKPIGKKNLDVGGVPFELPAGDKDHLDLRTAHWIEWKNDPADYYEYYDGGPPIHRDTRMPLLRIPLADYTAAHLLAVAEDDPNLLPVLTLRAGRYGWSDQVVMHDFPGTVSRRAEAAKVAAKVDTPAGPLFHARVPMTTAFAQDLSNFLEVEITKEVRLARRRPDPNRFRLRPLGLPSGVRIAAITFERSPLQMRVGSKESGHAFVEPQKPAFQVKLHNITPTEQAYQLTLTATHAGGAKVKATAGGKVAPGQTVEPELILPSVQRGFHEAVIALYDGAGKLLLERHTTMCLLPPETRKHRDTSPFGTWDFCGGHFTFDNPDITGPLYVKLGMRYGMFAYKPEQRKKYGMLPGNEPVVLGDAKGYADFIKAHPDSDPIALLFHEHSISGQHVTRIPDLFHDRPPYQLDDAEKKTYQKMLDDATAAAKAMRAQHPRVHLRFGNGTLPNMEEFFRRKYPAELFDSAGNESGSYGRLPEAQPPDCVAHNAGIWMIRQLLDAYGYKNKPVTHCLELCYPGGNPGNLSKRTQGDYFVRHSLHSLAWEMPHIKVGCITDMGNSYYFSNWGSTGFCERRPEINVKPGFVSMATLTRVLDGAKFQRVLDLGSPSLYGLEFKLPAGEHAYALWTIRDVRPVFLKGAGVWKHTDSQGADTMFTVQDKMEVLVSSSPIYLVGKGTLAPAGVGFPSYEDKPPADHKVVTPLANLDDWIVDKERDLEMEFYDFMCPRRQGDFAFEPVKSFEGKDNVLRITPRPIKHGKDTMPMYAALGHKQGLTLPGEPSEIGLWINGNSGWGRPIFELEDAGGQRWISLGAEQTDIPKKWASDMVPKDLLPKVRHPGINDWNTGDVFGIAQINFDGWRYVNFPLPGNYPGERYGWPGNSQWRSDKDGVVKYPLKLKRLIFELPEKVLHVKTFAPPPRREIYVKDLTVGRDEGRIVKLAAP